MALTSLDVRTDNPTQGAELERLTGAQKGFLLLISLDEAIAIMQSLLEREPSNPSVVVNLAETLQLAERFKESVMVADAFARRTVVPDLDIAWIGATSKALGSGDLSALRAVVDAAPSRPLCIELPS